MSNLQQLDEALFFLNKKNNVYHSKNKNSNHQLKAGEGKLMMTNGMSIKNFLSRYKLS